MGVRTWNLCFNSRKKYIYFASVLCIITDTYSATHWQRKHNFTIYSFLVPFAMNALAVLGEFIWYINYIKDCLKITSMKHIRTQWLMRAALTKYLKPRGLKQQKLFSHSSRGQMSLKMKVLSVSVPSEGRERESVHDSPELPMLTGNLWHAMAYRCIIPTSACVFTCYSLCASVSKFPSCCMNTSCTGVLGKDPP